MIDDAELNQGRVKLIAASFPKAYLIRGDKTITEFGTNRVFIVTSDPVDASAICWMINNGAALIKELEERRRNDK